MLDPKREITYTREIRYRASEISDWNQVPAKISKHKVASYWLKLSKLAGGGIP